MEMHPFRLVADITSAGTILATIAGWLPPIAAVLGIAWYLVLFYDRFIRKRIN